MWTTPSDLLRFIVGLQLAYRGDPGLLPSSVAREMLTAQRATDVRGQSIGLGVFLEGLDQDANSRTAAPMPGTAATCWDTSSDRSRSRS